MRGARRHFISVLTNRHSSFGNGAMVVEAQERLKFDF